MPVFIGGINAVAGERLLAIIDWRYFSAGDNEAFLDRLREQRMVFDITDGGRPKSLVITDKELYISPISPLTLKKRNDRLRKEICESDCVEEY